MPDLIRPPRLVRGGHDPHTGYGCAMNVIAYERDERVRTDNPPHVATPLAKMVQDVNDLVCLHGHYETTRLGREVYALCSTCAMRVLDLAHQTVDTADYEPAQAWRCVARLLRWSLMRTACAADVADYQRLAAVAAESMCDGSGLPELRFDFPALTTVAENRYHSLAMSVCRAASQVRTGRFGTDTALTGVLDAWVCCDAFPEDTGPRNEAPIVHSETMFTRAYQAIRVWHQSAVHHEPLALTA